MYENTKRAYKYRERPYNYRENQIREESRNRKIRKQLVFTDNEYKLLQNKMLKYRIDNFSEYVRFCLNNYSVTQNQINNFNYNEKNTQRKQICFNDEEIEFINSSMNNLNMNNFNLYIKLITLYNN